MNWLAALALLLAGAAGGYAIHGDRNQATIRAAELRASLCESIAGVQANSIDDVRVRLANLQQRHDDLLTAAHAALDARDAEIAALTQSAAQRVANLRSTADEDPAAAALARLPVPRAIADELWPAHAAAAGAAPGAH